MNPSTESKRYVVSGTGPWDQKGRGPVEVAHPPSVCPCLEDLAVAAQPLSPPKRHKPHEKGRRKGESCHYAETVSQMIANVAQCPPNVLMMQHKRQALKLEL